MGKPKTPSILYKYRSWENDLHFKNYESAIASEKYINIFKKSFMDYSLYIYHY